MASPIAPGTPDHLNQLAGSWLHTQAGFHAGRPLCESHWPRRCPNGAEPEPRDGGAGSLARMRYGTKIAREMLRAIHPGDVAEPQSHEDRLESPQSLREMQWEMLLYEVVFLYGAYGFSAQTPSSNLRRFQVSFGDCTLRFWPVSGQPGQIEAELCQISRPGTLGGPLHPSVAVALPVLRWDPLANEWYGEGGTPAIEILVAATLVAIGAQTEPGLDSGPE